MTPWEKEAQDLAAANFSPDEIAQEEQRQRKDFFSANFSSEEIDEYFGVKKFDPKPFRALVEENLRKDQEQKLASGAPPKEAEGFVEAFQAGFQMSVSGLAARGGMPDLSVSEDASMFYRIASQLGTVVGDVPAMMAGGWAGGASGAATGGAIGTVVPGIGNAAGAIGGGVFGAGAGSFALPTAMRKVLMDHYEKGDVQSFGDFWERASATFIEASKAGVIGGVTSGVGATVGRVASPLVKAGTTATLRTGSEIATMVTVGKALEGDTPEPRDFLDAAVVVGALHGTTKLASKFRKVYGEFGVSPTETAVASQRDPLVKQEMMAENTNFQKVGEIITGQKVAVSEMAPTPLPPKFEPISLEGQPNAVKEVLGSIGVKAPKSKEAFTFSKFYQDFVDRIDPIKRIQDKLTATADGGKVALSPDENPYLLGRLANDFKSKLKHVLEKGTIDHKTLETNGKSLQDIVAPVKKELQLFDGYLKSKGALDYFKKGLDPGITKEAANQYIELHSHKFEKAAKEVTDWSNRNLKMLRDSGRISKTDYEIFVEANENYVPFKRLLETEDGLAVKATREGLLKERTGSSLKTQSPLTSLIENAEVILKVSERNRATMKLVETIETFGDSSFGEKVQGKGALRENQFEIFRNGEREVWEVKDKSVAQAVKSLGGDPASSNIFMKVARGLTVAKKIGISFTPEFILRNFVRDQLTATVFSKQWHLPVIDTLVAMKDVLGKSEAYYAWLKSGGANASFLKVNESYFKTEILKLNEQTGFLNSTWNIIKSPIDMLKVAGTLVEEATRVAEFKRVSGGETSGPRVFEAGFASREVTVDFQRIGAKMAGLNAITAFQNVSIQGLDRTFRALKENPKAMTAASALITTASVSLWFANKDEDWYREVPQWERDTFWHTKIGEVVYRFPKPQELGVMFGSVPERVLEAFVKDNPNAFKEFSDTVGGLLVPSFIPDAVSTPLEQMVNRNLFTGNPVVNQAAEKLLPAYQFNDYTTEAAKGIAKLIEAIPYVKDVGPKDAKLSSPMVIENYVRGWTGSVGMYVLQAIDQGLVRTGVVKDQKPEASLSDIPFIKAFVSRYPSASTQSIKDFREKYEKIERVWATIKSLDKRGESDEAAHVVSMYEGDLIRLSGQKEAISNMHRAIQMLYMSDYEKHEKRQLIDSVYYQMIETAKSGNDVLNEIDRSISKRKFEKRLILP